MKKYSVIIPVYGNAEKTKTCLRSVLRHSAKYDYEIIVVSNGSDNDLNEWLKDTIRSDDIFLIHPKPLGFAKAVNLGIESCSGEYIVLLNNDAEVLGENWLELLEEPFHYDIDNLITNMPIGVTGPVSIYCPEVNKFFILFFCAMISRKCWEEVGVLDEQFEVGTSEDIDFCVRAENAGYSITVVPDDWFSESVLPDGRRKRVGQFPVSHEGGATVDQIDGFQEIYKDNLRKLKEKHADSEIDLERAMVSPQNIGECFRETSRYNWAKNVILDRFGFSRHVKEIADVACGSGYGSYILSDIPNSKITGADVDEKPLAFAKEHWQRSNIRYVKNDIESFLSESDCYDAIVCFETIEHLENWPYIIQAMKACADMVLVSVPYKEPEGFWGPYHVVHGLSEEDFKDFDICYMDCHSGEIVFDKPDDGIFLMLMSWVRRNEKVTITIPTCDRYDRLPVALQSVINQSYRDWDLMVIDATPADRRQDVQNNSLIMSMLNRIQQTGHNWHWLYNDFPGPQTSHQIALENSKTKFNFRMDDDTILDEDCLDNLMKVALCDSDIAAVGPMVLDPALSNSDLLVDEPVQGHIYNLANSPQWRIPRSAIPFEVEHLHCSFLYRTDYARDIGGWDLDLSPVGHREETDFSNRLWRSGKRLLVDPQAILWHYRDKQGGIRVHDESHYAHDNQLWIKKTKAASTDVLIKFDRGMGDTISMSAVINAMSMILNDRRIFACCSYPFLLNGVSGLTGTLEYYDEDVGNLFDIVFDKDAYDLGINFDVSCLGSYANMTMNALGFQGIDNIDLMLELPCVGKSYSEIDDKTIIVAPYAGRNFYDNSYISARRKDLDTDLMMRLANGWKSYGYKIAQVGSASEQLCGLTDIDLRGRDIKRIFGCLQKCKTFISADSVIAHAAAALKKPGVVIFRNTSAKVFGHDIHENIQLDCPHGYVCREQCSTFGFEVSESVCMEECLGDLPNYEIDIDDFVRG